MDVMKIEDVYLNSRTFFFSSHRVLKQQLVQIRRGNKLSIITMESDDARKKSDSSDEGSQEKIGKKIKEIVLLKYPKF